MRKFPESFYFGAATSSHQVEGGCSNDWSRWEKMNAARLVQEYARGIRVSTWDRLKPEGIIPENYISGRAVDHYNRYEEDFSIAKKIGLNAYRFSIEWSRIEPEDGVWNENELNHYMKLIRSLRRKNIEPFVTVWHWTLPEWLADNGGVLNPRFPFLFSRYAAKLADYFKNEVTHYITINEPEIYSLNGYMLGKWPPQKRNLILYIRAMNSLRTSHRIAYDEIKKINPDTLVGAACNITYFESAGGLLNRFAASAAHRLWNLYFINSIHKQADYIGVNYYFHNRIKYGLNKNENAAISDMGWELYPGGIYNVLLSLSGYKLPIFITENGLADAEDTQRSWFIKETLNAVYKAMEAGADVRGYFHWSLLDNFEWDKGFWPKFGLISVDRVTMTRKLRKSAKTYSRIIKRGIDV